MENKDKEVVERLYSIGNSEMFVTFLNYYSAIKDIKKEMVTCLDLLDKLADNPTKENKNKLRKVILDNFNELPRSTIKMLDDISKIIKEE